MWHHVTSLDKRTKVKFNQLLVQHSSRDQKVWRFQLIQLQHYPWPDTWNRKFSNRMTLPGAGSAQVACNICSYHLFTTAWPQLEPKWKRANIPNIPDHLYIATILSILCHSLMRSPRKASEYGSTPQPRPRRSLCRRSRVCPVSPFQAEWSQEQQEECPLSTPFCQNESDPQHDRQVKMSESQRQAALNNCPRAPLQLVPWRTSQPQLRGEPMWTGQLQRLHTSWSSSLQASCYAAIGSAQVGCQHNCLGALVQDLARDLFVFFKTIETFWNPFEWQYLVDLGTCRAFLMVGKAPSIRWVLVILLGSALSFRSETQHIRRSWELINDCLPTQEYQRSVNNHSFKKQRHRRKFRLGVPPAQEWFRVYLYIYHINIYIYNVKLYHIELHYIMLYYLKHIILY